MTDPTLAVHGGTPVRSTPMPTWPIPDQASTDAVAAVIATGHWFRVEGTQVDSFERRFAEHHQARFATCVTSGTTALDTGLRALGVGPGDEVIVPPYTFIASVMAIVYVGAVPVFVDIDPRTHVLDPTLLPAAVTSRTKAVMPVHLAGRPCDMDAITDVAHAHGISVIEDAAQSLSAEWRGRRVGAIGDVGAFSFQNSKNITAGEGGALTTNDPALADRIYSLANVGRARDGGWYEHPMLGYNLRLTEAQGALLHAQLDLHDERQRVRAQNAALLRSQLEQIDGVLLAPDDERITAHGMHLFLFRIPAVAGRKAAFLEALHAEGLPVTGGYPQGLHHNEALQAVAARNGGQHGPASCPRTDEVTQDTLVVPHWFLLDDGSAATDIAAGVRKVLAALDTL